MINAAWEYFLVCLIVLLLLSTMFAGCRVQRLRRTDLQLPVYANEHNRGPYPPAFVEVHTPIVRHPSHSAFPVLKSSYIEQTLPTYVFDIDRHPPLTPETGDEKNIPGLLTQHCHLTCIICFDEFVDKVSIIRKLPCRHIFHASCIDRWLTTCRAVCPLCKANIKKTDILVVDNLRQDHEVSMQRSSTIATTESQSADREPSPHNPSTSGTPVFHDPCPSD